MGVGSSFPAASFVRQSIEIADGLAFPCDSRFGTARNPDIQGSNTIIEPQAMPGANHSAAIFKAALDGVSEAVMLIDGDCKVLYANSLALDAVSSRQGLSLKPENRLFVEDEGSRALFMQALSRCQLLSKRNRELSKEMAIRVAISCAGSFPLFLTAQPLARQAADNDELIVALFIKESRSAVDDGFDMLRRGYGLSSGESDLVLQLSLGFVLKEIASRRKVSYETVRSQLRRVMQKTGTRRQADVIRLLRSEAEKFKHP